MIYFHPFGTNICRVTPAHPGRLAQLVERTLSMREVGGSKPPLSISFAFFFIIRPTVNLQVYINGLLIVFASGNIKNGLIFSVLLK
jgi:hypothetical protein